MVRRQRVSFIELLIRWSKKKLLKNHQKNAFPEQALNPFLKVNIASQYVSISKLYVGQVAQKTAARLEWTIKPMGKNMLENKQLYNTIAFAFNNVCFRFWLNLGIFRTKNKCEWLLEICKTKNRKLFTYIQMFFFIWMKDILINDLKCHISYWGVTELRDDLFSALS